jgi:hypothetical protein
MKLKFLNENQAQIVNSKIRILLDSKIKIDPLIPGKKLFASKKSVDARGEVNIRGLVLLLGVLGVYFSYYLNNYLLTNKPPQRFCLVWGQTNEKIF